jgi:hypothetical protein
VTDCETQDYRRARPPATNGRSLANTENTTDDCQAREENPMLCACKSEALDTSALLRIRFAYTKLKLNPVA